MIGSLRFRAAALAVLLCVAMFFVTGLAEAAGDPGRTFGNTWAVTGVLDGSGSAQACAIARDGKIVAVGVSGGDFAVARFNRDGSLDRGFSGDGLQTTDFGSSFDVARDVVLQRDGKIVAVGLGSTAGATTFGVARYNADGSLDRSFSRDGVLTTGFGATPGSSAEAYSVALKDSGEIVVVGVSAGGDFALARYSPSGTLLGQTTTDFGSTLDVAEDVLVQPDGKIVATGHTKVDDAGNDDFAIARYNADGSLDPTFSGDGMQTTDLGGADDAFSAALQPDGKLVAAGRAGFDFGMARYNADGSLDATFSDDGVLSTDFGNLGEDAATGVAIEADGTIVATGYVDGFSFSDTDAHIAIARYTPGGSPDARFSGDGRQITDIPGVVQELAADVAIAPDGTIVVVGGDRPAPQSEAFMVVRYAGGSAALDTAPARGVAGVNVRVKPVGVPGYAGVPLVCTRPAADCTALTGDTIVPVGAYLDATQGAVLLETRRADGSYAATAVYAGVFELQQARQPNAVLVAKLVGSLPQGCRRVRRIGGRKKAPRPRLWSDGSGRFRATGRYGTATVRGTKWLIEERCAGTFVHVDRGRVEVRDLTRSVTVLVSAPRSYLARPRR